MAIVSWSVQSAEAGEHNQDKSITASHIIVYMVFSYDAHDGWIDWLMMNLNPEPWTVPS